MPAWTMPWGLQASAVGVQVALDPAQVLAVDAVGGERGAHEPDDLHAAVAQPAVHVLALARSRRHRSAGLSLALSGAGTRNPRS